MRQWKRILKISQCQNSWYSSCQILCQVPEGWYRQQQSSQPDPADHVRPPRHGPSCKLHESDDGDEHGDDQHEPWGAGPNNGMRGKSDEWWFDERNYITDKKTKGHTHTHCTYCRFWLAPGWTWNSAERFMVEQGVWVSTAGVQSEAPSFTSNCIPFQAIVSYQKAGGDGMTDSDQKDPLLHLWILLEATANRSQGIVELDHAIMHQQISQNHGNHVHTIIKQIYILYKTYINIWYIHNHHHQPKCFSFQKKTTFHGHFPLWISRAKMRRDVWDHGQ